MSEKSSFRPKEVDASIGVCARCGREQSLTQGVCNSCSTKIHDLIKAGLERHGKWLERENEINEQQRRKKPYSVDDQAA